MDYFVECLCGKQSPVNPALAGSTILCDCGRTVTVPRLSALRQAAGQGAFEAGIVDTVRRGIATGELPSIRQCALTGEVTDDTVEVLVVCERKWLRGPGKRRWAFAILTVLFLPFWPLWILLSWALLDEKREELGRNTVVRLPLRVRGDQRVQVMRLSQRRLRRLLRMEPVYAKLLEEYPGATMRVARSCD